MHCDKQTSQFCNIYYKYNVLPNCKSQLQSSIGNCVTNATFPYFVEFLLRTSICNLLQMQHVHTVFNSNYKVQFVSFNTNPKFPYAPLKLSVQIFPWLRIIVKSGWISRVRSFQEQNLQSKDLKESNGFYQLWWPIATISKLPTFNIGARLT